MPTDLLTVPHVNCNFHIHVVQSHNNNFQPKYQLMKMQSQWNRFQFRFFLFVLFLPGSVDPMWIDANSTGGLICQKCTCILISYKITCIHYIFAWDLLRLFFSHIDYGIVNIDVIVEEISLNDTTQHQVWISFSTIATSHLFGTQCFFLPHFKRPPQYVWLNFFSRWTPLKFNVT